MAALDRVAKGAVDPWATAIMPDESSVWVLVPGEQDCLNTLGRGSLTECQLNERKIK